MAWIESHDDIWEHHKTIKLCALLKRPDYSVVGHLHSLWHFILRNAWRDANLEPWGDCGIERAARWDGAPGQFVKAMREVELLDGWTAHGWMERAGSLVYDRLRKEMSRQSSLKRRTSPEIVQEHFRTNSGQSEATVPNRTVPNRTEQPSPPKVAEREGFEAFWSAYPRKVAKQSALRGWRRLKANEELLKRIIEALERHKQSQQWQQDGGRFIPHPATWLNQKRWEDEVHDGCHDAGAAKPVPGKYARISES